MICTLGGRFPRDRPRAHKDVGQLDVATGRGGFSLTFLIAPLPCRNKDFRTRSFPAGVATRRSNHLMETLQNN